MEKRGTARQAAGGSTIRRVRIVCWIPKATNTHSQYVTYCFPKMTMVMGTRLNITLALMLSVLLGSRISVVF